MPECLNDTIFLTDAHSLIFCCLDLLTNVTVTINTAMTNSLAPQGDSAGTRIAAARCASGTMGRWPWLLAREKYTFATVTEVRGSQWKFGKRTFNQNLGSQIFSIYASISRCVGYKYGINGKQPSSVLRVGLSNQFVRGMDSSPSGLGIHPPDEPPR